MKLVSTLLIAALLSGTAATGSDEYIASVEEWYAGRIERLTSETGYLTLIGLHELGEGAYTFGMGEDNDIVLPAKGPEHAGTLTNSGGTITLDVVAVGELLHNDKPIEHMVLVPDTSEDYTVITMGTVSFLIIERAGRLLMRVKDSESELRRNFKGIERYPVDESWAIKARFERYDPPIPMTVNNIMGYDVPVQCPGRIVFERDGKTHSLEPIADTPWGLFVVFGDATSGNETYGAGRFVYVDAPEGDSDTVTIDFNRAYNPPCVFTTNATCTIPHDANMLPIPVLAGEKITGWSQYGEH